ncbi:hypothetical protein ASPWEDRAFT_40281 [Aspergillus wentii DTO 134E9]|uniref:Uncharacterized protein n=1 Tax=Aspergillus wentii DTO 134E9 TaxID=1073089 RepID=A0A1L9RJU2_ASPWE|nr:uncharacterized protein ASPWEDRAFT_40281 [Aspergillus wentii DTO 134E9]KAI9931925.1 hypothetical protein MW887_009426 [Aspergillus wentii]OJJ35118.1 hypothetical protein ASPWEDRAFT_40281 [Aspergillus wentii DTO 134E9]
MYFSKLLAVASAFAPVALAYSVATVDFDAHEHCPVGKWPTGDAADEQKLVATKDTCSSAKVKHSFDIDTYSFSADIITPDTPFECQGVGIYANEDCDGEPDYFLPFDGKKPHVQSPCLPDHFDKFVSVKLLCHGHHKPHHGFHGLPNTPGAPHEGGH